MADALRSGNLGVMDEYRLRNLDSDTRMRDGIAGDRTELDPTDED
ncbi:MAG: flotillin-like FloA family protein, partial [Planctomycetes bacterium]|nr:flotillin-like FloA family protein [Planctomycetota bacterium]